MRPARTKSQAPPSAIRLRPIALPAEHGSWGLVIEPIVLGLLVAPSVAGLCLGAGAFATFLTRRPLKVALTQGKRDHSGRGRIALAFAMLYGAIALIGFTATVVLEGFRPLSPLVLVSPLVGVFLLYDLRNQSRTWQAELAGAGVFAVLTASIAMAAHWAAAPALALTAVLLARNVASVLYVRNRVRLDRGRPHDRGLVLAIHAAALLGIGSLVAGALLPWPALIPFIVLLARALEGLSARRRPATMRAIGFTEMAYGILTVLAVVIGHWITTA
jgi:hypothetical protein